MKLKSILVATCLLLPMSSATFAATVDDYIAGLKKEASIGNTEAQKELDQFQSLSKKANAGDAQAQYEFGMFYKSINSGSSLHPNKDYAQKQEQWLLKAANQGNIDAQRELVLFYANKNTDGTDVETNKKIEMWLTKLAQTGEANYQYALAKFYEKSKDDATQKKAGEWIKKAADQGLLAARFDLGEGYLYGDHGIAKNYNKAYELYKKLNDEKYVGGAYYLAKCYLNGFGVPKDITKAIELYKIAADNGHIPSAVFLSQTYFAGINNSVDPDKDEFWKYFNMVCKFDGSRKSMACIRLNSEIMQTCMDKHNHNVDFMDENSTIDPLCREVAIKVMSTNK